MKALYIVVNDNYASISNRIEYAFFNKSEANEYAKECNKNSDNEYWVESIFLHD